jgi:hypothetical protein
MNHLEGIDIQKRVRKENTSSLLTNEGVHSTQGGSACAGRDIGLPCQALWALPRPEEAKFSPEAKGFDTVIGQQHRPPRPQSVQTSFP